MLLDQPSHRRRCGNRRFHLLQYSSQFQANTSVVQREALTNGSRWSRSYDELDRVVHVGFAVWRTNPSLEEQSSDRIAARLLRHRGGVVWEIYQKERAMIVKRLVCDGPTQNCLTPR